MVETKIMVETRWRDPCSGRDQMEEVHGQSHPVRNNSGTRGPGCSLLKQKWRGPAEGGRPIISPDATGRVDLESLTRGAQSKPEPLSGAPDGDGCPGSEHESEQ